MRCQVPPPSPRSTTTPLVIHPSKNSYTNAPSPAQPQEPLQSIPSQHLRPHTMSTLRNANRNRDAILLRLISIIVIYSMTEHLEIARVYQPIQVVVIWAKFCHQSIARLGVWWTSRRALPTAFGVFFWRAETGLRRLIRWRQGTVG